MSTHQPADSKETYTFFSQNNKTQHPFPKLKKIKTKVNSALSYVGMPTCALYKNTDQGTTQTVHLHSWVLSHSPQSQRCHQGDGARIHGTCRQTSTPSEGRTLSTEVLILSRHFIAYLHHARNSVTFLAIYCSSEILYL